MILPDDCVVYKIGMTKSNRATDRMMEILRSWFCKYRFVPYTELRLDMEFGFPEALEKHIHAILSDKRFIPNEKVDGGTEMFIDINEFRVIQYLKQCNDEVFAQPLGLSKQDYKHLCQLVSP